jgi:tetratricopeptide (TPR) repeat protein
MRRRPVPGQPASPALGRRHADWLRVVELAKAGQLREAAAITDRHLKPGSRDADFLRMRATIEKHLGDAAASLRWALAAEAVASHPDTALIVARAEMRAGRTDAAIARCEAVLRASPGNTRARLVVAEALESAMRVAEAAEALESLRRDAAEEASVAVRVEYMRASVMIHQGRFGEAVEALDASVLRSGDGEKLLRRGWHLRAKALDRAGRFDEAFVSAARANAIGERPFDPAQYESAVDGLLRLWTREAMRDFPSSHADSEVPVFIAGMPRSGTSLLDQVIDAHPQAAGVGEMKDIERFAAELERAWQPALPAPDCFGAMRDRAFRNAAQGYLGACAREAPGARRVVNKALGNNRMLGLVARLFPRTRVIHALRDPRDVAVSCFMGGFNNASYPWTTRLDWIACAWRQSERLMRHWRETLDLPMLDVRYEEVVGDPGTAFPRFIEFLGLPWDDACTRFHESRRTVRTLSYDQVNRPLYATSVDRWRRYERHLAGVDWPAYP